MLARFRRLKPTAIHGVPLRGKETQVFTQTLKPCRNRLRIIRLQALRFVFQRSAAGYTICENAIESCAPTGLPKPLKAL